MNNSNQICTFHMDKLFLGLRAERVQETSRNHKITPVPLAPAVIRGVINLRGRISTAINLCELLSLEKKEATERTANIVIRTENNELLNLLVDSIDDILEVDDDCFELPPETLADSVRGLIEGAYKLENRILLLLDHKELFHRISECTKLKPKKDKLH